MKLLLPDIVPLSPEVPDGVEVAYYRGTEPLPTEHRDAEAVVVWGAEQPMLDSLVRDLPNLRWVQSLAAGTDQIEAAGLSTDVVLTSGRGLHDATVAEHTVALTLAAVRRLPAAAAAQVEHRWAAELGGIRPLHGDDGAVTTLIDARVLVWGFGSIAQRLAPVLAALGADVRGVARSAGERAGFPVLAEAEIDAALPETDVLIMILPATPATHHALDADRLARLPRTAFVVNVGRGATVDEDALVAALTEGRLAGAALDVTAVEPLPEDSPLWDAPNLILTPHAAGGRVIGADELISDNLAAVLEGRPLRNVVDR